ncbi:MAG: tRNA uridine(34) 5-carboxymethylaminomethyl modification radical SAM/GNAT enzyme Elp3 [Candidatus Heimdallarchaeota archaeon]|nr:tRNA uridine(34) 5-carboxymethylaminomethyl modification radical SAM/GNAT enzyme Elp3 [Candidatus Heimdallarchaeota archaeon]
MKNPESSLIDIKEALLNLDIVTEANLNQIKRGIAKKYHLDSFPRNSDILAICTEEEKQKLLPILMKRKVRTLSGVAVVAVMTRPWECPHGKCIVCPGGPDNDRPQSYTGYEPTTMRGIRNNYDPYIQVQERISQLEAIGHSAEKIDAIIMGGTYTHQPLEYQQEFILRMFDAMNDVASTNIQEAHKLNETAKYRCVGLTIETRPDQISHDKIDHLIDFGVTRLELGVQSVFDDVLEKMNRGHGTKEIIDSFKFTRDSGLKLTAHMMPGLPGSSYDRDIASFYRLFNDNRYRPDELKIYPTMVIPGTQLYDDYIAGDYEALSNEKTAKLVAEIKTMIPPYVRIKRVLRDIPAHQIAGGPNKSDLRLDAQAILVSEGKKCRCIRCREIGRYIYQNKGDFDANSIHLVQRKYSASEGIEHFLSYEEVQNDVLIGFLRLRELSKDIIRSEFIEEPTIVVRELHVYGESLELHSSSNKPVQWQHKGYGKKLLLNAENIASDKGYNKISVISGVGVREYYRTLGYELDGPYMSKSLK